ncbi:hypothetical protein DH86_00000143 [Scytalidium sp. 3C]|nr:hypothetical protein DH86_00000143 [Scytalidium sp. 3C]
MDRPDHSSQVKTPRKPVELQPEQKMSKRSSMEVSHGRGGAGNISEDHTVYGDGEIVREGTVGDHGDGAFSTGRGGAANIGGSPALKADQRKDHEIVPEVALRPSMEKENFHTGRGGEGNVHHAEPTPGKPQHPEGLADKLKHKLFGKKKEHTAA